MTLRDYIKISFTIILFLIFPSSFAQIRPEVVKPPGKIIYNTIIEKVEMSNELTPVYKIIFKNPTDKSISLSQCEVTIIHLGMHNWTPKLELVSPKNSTVISPGETIELVYRCIDSKETILEQIDRGALKYNAENKIEVSIRIPGEDPILYEGTLLWKPKLADLRIKSARFELDKNKSGFIRCKLVIENIGDDYPIFKKKATSLNELSLFNLRLIDKEGKEELLEMKPTGNLSPYDLHIAPGKEKEIEIINNVFIPNVYFMKGELKIIMGFDEPLVKNKTIYSRAFGDSNPSNNILTSSVSFGRLFSILSFYPEKVSILKPVVSKDYPREEYDLMYITVSSYGPLNLFDGTKDIKMYFEGEELRIFSIKLDKWKEPFSEYKIWVKKPKKVGRGRLRVEIFGISDTASKYLEVTDKLILSSTSGQEKISWPFYFDSTPEYTFYFGKEDPEPLYGSMPISITDINIKGNLPINIFISLMNNSKYKWLDSSKNIKDIDISERQNYGESYFVRVYVRPLSKIQWRLLEEIESPVYLESGKRTIIKVTLDEISSLLKGLISPGENELLVLIGYTFTYREFYKASDGAGNLVEKEKISKYNILSDMYCTRFRIGE